ncbi:MAG: tRNA (adenosine(37)-N6)-dimethylallyltransferase MiaA [Flavobacteriales bacterium]|nr:tRNA (adenosine(37)-N6)-dimethylallyltransferase MiaA [Flavobacteriales bacterium]|tara:strand:- start:81 stop:992 length:912 start_codon:yes stop_codon:yes gene_type:complete
MTEDTYLISVVGPTAVGKTSLAIFLANTFDAEIISADSRQFFKELTIGTAKPTEVEQSQAKHHFIDNLSIREEYNASKYENDVLAFLEEYFQNHSIAILCGGSGMYVDALLNGFDEELPSADERIRAELNQKLEAEGLESLQAELKELDPDFYETVDLQNSKRVMRAIEICRLAGKPYSKLRKGKRKYRAFKIIKIGLELPREELYKRINLRVDQMMEQGLLEEVETVSQYREHNALKTVGYREFFPYLEGEIRLDEAIEKVKVNSRRYAKRQMSWFKRDKDIKWFQPTDKKEIIQYIRNRIE